MTPSRGALYALVMFMVLQTFAYAIGFAVVYDTRNAQSESRDALVIGCVRGNNTREAQHWLATHVAGFPPVLLERLTVAEHPQILKPWLVDCAAAYR